MKTRWEPQSTEFKEIPLPKTGPEDVLMKRLAGGNGEGLTGKTISIPVRILTDSTVNSIYNNKVIVENSLFEKQELDIDTIVIAHLRSINDLYRRLIENGFTVANMGDSVEPRNLRHAVRDGAHYGLITDEGTYMSGNKYLCSGLPAEVDLTKT